VTLDIVAKALATEEGMQAVVTIMAAGARKAAVVAGVIAAMVTAAEVVGVMEVVAPGVDATG
jgi:hypothetical protein